MVKPMSKAFRPGDQRRVQAAFDEMMPEGYAAEVSLSRDRKTMTIVCMDPEAPEIFIANAQFDFAEKQLKRRGIVPNQPPDEEVMLMATQWAAICEAYPAAKARQEGEQLFKTDFAERKEQYAADEAAQAERDKLLLRTDAEEAEAMAQDRESR